MSLATFTKNVLNLSHISEVSVIIFEFSEIVIFSSLILPLFDKKRPDGWPEVLGLRPPPRIFPRNII